MNIGKYALIREIGRGGFGIIYEATDTTLQRKVAVKVLHPHLMIDQTMVNRFLQEAKFASMLQDDHIVPIFDFGQFEGHYFLVMEYMPNGSLKDLLAKHGKLQQSAVERISKQLILGLEAAHSHNIIHRDIKPGNILFDKNNNARISDLGFAKFTNPTGNPSITTTGSVIGTPGYIPPEIWKGTQATAATDQYGLACIICEMFSGAPLFAGDSPPEVMMNHFQQRRIPSEVPDSWKNVLLKALSIDPAQRYLSISDFGKALSAPDTTARSGVYRQASTELGHKEYWKNPQYQLSQMGTGYGPQWNQRNEESPLTAGDDPDGLYYDRIARTKKSDTGTRRADKARKKKNPFLILSLLLLVLIGILVTNILLNKSTTRVANNPTNTSRPFVTATKASTPARSTTATPPAAAEPAVAESLIRIESTGLCTKSIYQSDNCISSWTNTPATIRLVFRSSVLKEGQFYLTLNKYFDLKCVADPYSYDHFVCEGAGQPINKSIDLEIKDANTKKIIGSGSIILFVPTSKYDG